MELLKVENLTFTYPRQAKDLGKAVPALKDVSFQVQDGGVYRCLRRVWLRQDHTIKASGSGNWLPMGKNQGKYGFADARNIFPSGNRPVGLAMSCKIGEPDGDGQGLA